MNPSKDLFTVADHQRVPVSPEFLAGLAAALPTDELVALRGIVKYSPDQPRDNQGQWTDDGGSGPTPVEITGLETHYRQPDGTLTRWPDLKTMRREYMKAHPGTRVMLSRRSRIVETMAAFDTLDQLQTKFPAVTINGIAVGDTGYFERVLAQDGRGVLAYCEDTGDGSSNIMLNPKFWTTDGSGNLYMGDGGGFHPAGTNDPDGYITHEFGHAVDHAYGTPPIHGGSAWQGQPRVEASLAYQAWADWRFDFREAPPVSGYGRTNTAENFAEAFTAAYGAGSRSRDSGAAEKFREAMKRFGVDR